MTRHKVLVTDPLGEAGVGRLQRAPGVDLELAYEIAESDLIARMPSCHALIVRSRTRVSEAMLKAAVRARRDARRSDVVMVGVTVLTHLTFEDFHSLFATDRSPRDTVLALAELARLAGLDGVVASAQEVSIIKRRMGSEFTVVTPGIRLADDSADDQTRVVTPRQAVDDGADYLVVGRPITAAADPAGACQRFLENMTP